MQLKRVWVAREQTKTSDLLVTTSVTSESMIVFQTVPCSYMDGDKTAAKTVLKDACVCVDAPM